MRETHRHVLKSNSLLKVLTSYPRVAFRNVKFLEDRLVRSNLNPESDIATVNFNCNSKRCKICKILVSVNEIKSFVTKKKNEFNFVGMLYI